MRGSCLSWVSSTSPQPDLLKGLQTLASHRRSQCVLRECELTLLLQASRICEILFCSALWPCLGVLGCLSQDIMPMLRPSEIACFCMCEHLGGTSTTWASSQTKTLWCSYKALWPPPRPSHLHGMPGCEPATGDHFLTAGADKLRPRRLFVAILFICSRNAKQGQA